MIDGSNLYKRFITLLTSVSSSVSTNSLKFCKISINISVWDAVISLSSMLDKISRLRRNLRQHPRDCQNPRFENGSRSQVLGQQLGSGLII